MSARELRAPRKAVGEGVDCLVEVPALGRGLRVAGPAAPRVAVGEAMAPPADPAHALVLPQA